MSNTVPDGYRMNANGILEPQNPETDWLDDIFAEQWPDIEAENGFANCKRLIGARQAEAIQAALQRLLTHAREYGVPDVQAIERNGEFLNAVPVSVIEAALQHNKKGNV